MNDAKLAVLELNYYATPEEPYADEDAYECRWCSEMCREGEPHDRCEEEIQQRTCWNKECPEYDTCFVDYEMGEPCESCGKPLGEPGD